MGRSELLRILSLSFLRITLFRLFRVGFVWLYFIIKWRLDVGFGFEGRTSFICGRLFFRVIDVSLFLVLFRFRDFAWGEIFLLVELGVEGGGC